MNGPTSRTAVPAAAALAALLPAVASAAPAISGADDDVWNAATAPPSYVVTGTRPDAVLSWQVRDADGRAVAGLRGSGASPLTVTLANAPDGELTLTAAQRAPRDPGRTSRTFTLDTAPPTIAVTRPSADAVYDLGERVAAAFSCAGATSCAGSVADGAPIDTSGGGAHTFSVDAADAAGNTASALVPYRVRAGATAGAPPSGPSGTPAPPSPPIRLAPPAPAEPQEPVPAVLHPARARPSAGAVVTTRTPVLRWTRVGSARLYNVQAYRVRGGRITKVLSAFPERPALRVPAGRLAWGERYVWRVWPLVRNRYAPRPHTLSWFDVRRPVRLTASQLRVNQRISQAALRRTAAVDAWLDAGIAGRDLRDGGLGREDFAGTVRLAGAGTAIANGLATPRPVAVAPPTRARRAPVRVSAGQLLINQRISQAAVRRANALSRRLDGGLTGGDLTPGAVSATKLAPGLAVASAAPVGPRTSPSSTRVATPGGRRHGRVALTDRQVLINQRISQAAVRRANGLVALARGGLTGAQFRDGSIGAAGIAPRLR
ncbi:MAG TPA: hypothetical protein VFG74_02505 [Miltoncostaeaceae bacterium]|nr:hypothetical protein [Miltoncostaeaceae bacterium]